MRGRFLFLVVALAIAGGYWFGVRKTLDDGVRVVNAHERELDEILDLIRRNNELCWLTLTDAGPCATSDNPTPPSIVTPDVARIHELMREVGTDDIDIHHGWNTGKLIFAEFSLFGESLIPYRGPIVAEWFGGVDVNGFTDCKPARKPYWKVCAYAPDQWLP